MAWKSAANSPLGITLPGAIDTTALVPVGTITKFFDDAFGEGEFIYLPGVASLAAGDCVEYDLSPGLQAVTRHSNATASNKGWPLAFSTAANILTTTFSWYQISGVAIANVAAGFAAAQALFGTGTAGVIDDGADAGDQILNGRSSSAIGTPAANKAYVTIERPFVQGQIT